MYRNTFSAPVNESILLHFQIKHEKLLTAITYIDFNSIQEYLRDKKNGKTGRCTDKQIQLINTFDLRVEKW